MAQVVDYATPQQQRRCPWLIVLMTVMVLALVAAAMFSYAVLRQRQAALRAIQAQQQAAGRAAQAARQQQAAFQQQSVQTRPAAPQIEPSVEQP